MDVWRISLNFISYSTPVLYRLKLCLLLTCCVLLVRQSRAQESTILEVFNATEAASGVYLNWTISVGNTCTGIQIQRSADNLYFYQIGDIPGVCGSSATAQSFTFLDANPIKNAVSYYRLVLGNTGYSRVVSIVVIDIQNRGYQVRPNPFREATTIYFDNDKKSTHVFILYSGLGMEVLRINSKTNYFDLQSGNLTSGAYLFSILDDVNSLRVRGKVLIID